MQEEDLLISCGMTPIRKLNYHSIYLPHGILTKSSLDLSSQKLEPTDQLSSQTLFWWRVALVRESRVWARRATISYHSNMAVIDRGSHDSVA